MRTVFVCAVLALCTLALANGAFAVNDPIADEVASAMNTSVDPCVDFYAYACGGWIAKTKLPPSKGKIYRGFGTIEEYNNKIIAEILKDPEVHPKIKTFYESCMNVELIEKFGYQPIRALLSYFYEAVGSSKSLFYLIGQLHLDGFPMFFSAGSEIDAKNPSTMIAGFSQGGIALPDRSFYLDDSEDDKLLQRQYVAHIQKMFELVGETPSQAAGNAARVFEFEYQLANISLSNADLFDPFSTYNKLDLVGLKKISPNLPWDSYIAGTRHKFDQINIQAPEFFKGLDHLIATTDRDTWIPYLRWCTLHFAAPYLSSQFVNADFEFFGRILNGLKAPAPRNESCIEYLDAGLGELLGAAYAKIAFSGNSLEDARSMIHDIEEAFDSNLNNLKWMDKVTLAEAKKKLTKVENMIGFPAHPDTYESVKLWPRTFFDNVIIAQHYASNKTFNSIGKPTNPEAWEMTANTVNAYYEPTRNQMVFPAGILQKPYFSAKQPDAMNFGGMGMIMGHELTHGFDPQGRFYNGSGYLENWWQPETAKAFQSRANCLIKQYNKFEVLPGVFINGNFTQGENTADCGGIKSAYFAFKSRAGANAEKPSIVSGLSNIQLFFVSFAQGWCSVASPAYLKVQVESDPHSPAKFRVLGPLMNLPQFSEVFKCPANAPMNPSDRCEIW